jgi:hypothetical protein
MWLAPNVTMLDQTPLQHAAHLDSLRKFARRKHIPENTVVAVFETERHRLTERAKVETFVDVIAEKRARGRLRRMTRTA